MKLEVGQTVYVQPIGNKRRYTSDIAEAKVSKIGKKYFELEGYYRERFYLDSGLNDGRGYISDYHVRLSLQEIEDEKEITELSHFIGDRFQYGQNRDQLSLEQLRKIKAIIVGEEK